jgi:hypothetical protein
MSLLSYGNHQQTNKNTGENLGYKDFYTLGQAQISSIFMEISMNVFQ